MKCTLYFKDLAWTKKKCKNSSNIVHSFIQELGTPLIIKNRAKNKTSSVLALMEPEVDAVKHFLPLLIGLSKEHSDYPQSRHRSSPDAMSRTGMCFRNTLPIATWWKCHFLLSNETAIVPGEHLKDDEYELEHALNVKCTLRFEDSTKNECKYLIHLLYWLHGKVIYMYIGLNKIYYWNEFDLFLLLLKMWTQDKLWLHMWPTYLHWPAHLHDDIFHSC